MNGWDHEAVIPILGGGYSLLWNFNESYELTYLENIYMIYKKIL